MKWALTSPVIAARSPAFARLSNSSSVTALSSPWVIAASQYIYARREEKVHFRGYGYGAPGRVSNSGRYRLTTTIVSRLRRKREPVSQRRCGGVGQWLDRCERGGFDIGEEINSLVTLIKKAPLPS